MRDEAHLPAFATENAHEPDLAWPPPPVEPVDGELEQEVDSFFGTKRVMARRAATFGTAALCVSLATAAIASESRFDIRAEIPSWRVMAAETTAPPAAVRPALTASGGVEARR